MKKLRILMIAVATIIAAFSLSSCIDADREAYTKQINLVESPRMFFPNSSGITWDHDSSTLTLNNATIDCSNIKASESAAAITLPDYATIKIIGDNKIIAPKTMDDSVGYYNSFGILAGDECDIIGAGRLNIEINESSLTSCGIYSSHELTIGNAVLLTISSNNENIYSQVGLYSEGSIANAGSVTIEITDFDYSATAIYVGEVFTNFEDAFVAIDIENGQLGYGIYSGFRLFNDGQIVLQMIDCETQMEGIAVADYLENTGLIFDFIFSFMVTPDYNIGMVLYKALEGIENDYSCDIVNTGSIFVSASEANNYSTGITTDGNIYSYGEYSCIYVQTSKADVSQAIACEGLFVGEKSDVEITGGEGVDSFEALIVKDKLVVDDAELVIDAAYNSDQSIYHGIFVDSDNNECFYVQNKGKLISTGSIRTSNPNGLGELVRELIITGAEELAEGVISSINNLPNQNIDITASPSPSAIYGAVFPKIVKPSLKYK